MSVEELLIYYEHEVETLRARIRQQNVDISSLARQIEVRYQLYSSLEEEYNSLKKEYEQLKTDTIKNCLKTLHVSPNVTLPEHPPYLQL